MITNHNYPDDLWCINILQLNMYEHIYGFFTIAVLLCFIDTINSKNTR